MDEITVGDFPGATMEWLAGHGYRCGHISVHGHSGFGVLYGRANESMCLAVPGDVLAWDGQNVIRQEA